MNGEQLQAKNAELLGQLAKLFQERAEAKATLAQSDLQLQKAMIAALSEYDALEAAAARVAQALRESGIGPDPQAVFASQFRSAARAVLVELRHALNNRNEAGVDFAGARIVAIAKEEQRHEP